MKLLEKNREETSYRNFLEYQKYKSNKAVKDVMCIWSDVCDQNGNILDVHLMRIMPVFFNDKLEDIVRRYSKTFPEEVFALKKEIELNEAINESGMSKQKTVRRAASIPEKLLACLRMVNPSFLTKNNIRKSLIILKSICPKLVIGNV